MLVRVKTTTHVSAMQAALGVDAALSPYDVTITKSPGLHHLRSEKMNRGGTQAAVILLIQAGARATRHDPGASKPSIPGSGSWSMPVGGPPDLESRISKRRPPDFDQLRVPDDSPVFIRINVTMQFGSNASQANLDNDDVRQHLKKQLGEIFPSASKASPSSDVSITLNATVYDLTTTSSGSYNVTGSLDGIFDGSGQSGNALGEAGISTITGIAGANERVLTRILGGNISDPDTPDVFEYLSSVSLDSAVKLCNDSSTGGDTNSLRTRSAAESDYDWLVDVMWTIRGVSESNASDSMRSLSSLVTDLMQLNTDGLAASVSGGTSSETDVVATMGTNSELHAEVVYSISTKTDVLRELLQESGTSSWSRTSSISLQSGPSKTDNSDSSAASPRSAHQTLKAAGASAIALAIVAVAAQVAVI